MRVMASVGSMAILACYLFFFGVAPAEADEKAAETVPSAADEEDTADPDQPEIEDAMIELALKPWTGDFDAMRKRRVIRVLVVNDNAFYFVDKYRQRGATYELMMAFEKELNKRYKLKKAEAIHFFFIPVTNDRLISGVAEGLGDIAANNLTITPERQELVDFSIPFTDKVQEVLISSPGFPEVTNVEELSGLEVAVRRSSSYYESLQALNQRLEAAGKDPVRIIAIDERLDDATVVEMLAAGVYPAGVMESYLAKLWAEVSDKLVVHEEIVLREGGSIGWAFRKDSPLLAKEINDFVKRHKVGSLTTNILIKRYLQNPKYVEEAVSPEKQKRFEAMVELFKTYGEKYELDWLLLIAQGYQESGLDQSVVSPVGAVGLMQILPKTAAGNPINIKGIDKADNNVNAGAKYLRYLIDDYFDEPGIDTLNRHLFAFAGYNAGPNRLQRLRKKAAKAGLDPNVWFNNVELLVAKEVGREPVTYVANIFKYFVTYERIRRQQAEVAAAEQQAEQ